MFHALCKINASMHCPSNSVSKGALRPWPISHAIEYGQFVGPPWKSAPVFAMAPDDPSSINHGLCPLLRRARRNAPTAAHLRRIGRASRPLERGALLETSACRDLGNCRDKQRCAPPPLTVRRAPLRATQGSGSTRVARPALFVAPANGDPDSLLAVLPVHQLLAAHLCQTYRRL